MSVDRSRLPRPDAPPPVRFPPVAKRSLDGWRLWAIEHRDLPVVAFVWLVPVGSAADPFDQPGLAALVADLLDEGSAGRSMIEFHEALARLGAQLDVEIGVDATTISLVTLSRFAEPAAALLADMVCRPNLIEAEFERVRTLRLNRLIQLRRVPGAVADHLIFRQIYGSHPYGHPSLGTERGLTGITLDAVHVFHRRQLLGVQPTVIVAGDLSTDEVDAMMARLDMPPISDGSPSESAVAPGFAPPITEIGAVQGPRTDLSSARIRLIDRPVAAQSEIRVGGLGAARDTAHYYALLVANAVVGGAFMSRINLNLRERRGVTYGARSSVQFWRAPGPFLVQASVQSDATGVSVGEILRELRDLGNERPVEGGELERARDTLTRGYARNFETAEQLARAAAHLALYDLPDSWYDDYVPRVDRVDADEVTGVARAWFDPGRMQVGVVGDAARVRVALAEHGEVGLIADPEDLVRPLSRLGA